MARWVWIVRKFTQRLWVRSALYCLMAVVTALAAPMLEPFIPEGVASVLTAEAVDRLLAILASSMLAVTTFSLGAMVSSHAAITGSASPRAVKLVTDDRVTQNMLGAFLGSFLYSLVALMALQAGTYGDRGHVVLFLVTAVVVVMVVATLLAWIDHLTRLGRVGEATERVEQAALEALRERADAPCLGARPLLDPDAQIPHGARPVAPDRIGYVQHVDVETIAACARPARARVWIVSPPGAFVDPTRPLAWVEGVDDEKEIGVIRRAFTLDDERTFDHDPRFGLIVLAEIASRALSPGVNDPGTAIDVIGRAVRVLADWAGHAPAETADRDDAPPVWLPPLSADDLFDDVFRPIARDGAGSVEVQIRLRKALVALCGVADGRLLPTAMRHAADALERAEAELPSDLDRRALRAVSGPAGT